MCKPMKIFEENVVSKTLRKGSSVTGKSVYDFSFTTAL